MNALAGIAVVAYAASLAFAVYERLPISDWLTSHLLPAPAARRKTLVCVVSCYGAHAHCASTRPA